MATATKPVKFTAAIAQDYVPFAAHVLGPCIPQSSSFQSSLETCLHWTDWHTGDQTNTWDWINGLDQHYYARLHRLLRTPDIDEAVAEIDRRARTENLGVEELIDNLLG